MHDVDVHLLRLLVPPRPTPAQLQQNRSRRAMPSSPSRSWRTQDKVGRNGGAERPRPRSEARAPAPCPSWSVWIALAPAAGVPGFRCPRPTPSVAAHPHQLGGGSLLSGARQYKVVLRQAVICDLQPYTNEFLEFTYSYSQLFQEELQVHVHQSLSTNLQQSPVDLHAGVD